MIEVQTSAINKVEVRDETEHRKEYLCADLLSLQPRCQKQIPPLPKHQKKSGQFDSLIPRTIKGLETFYYILRRQKSLLIYQVYPSVTCIQFNFEVEPIGLHIFNHTVYFLTSLSSIAVASLLNDQQPTELLIPTIGKPYSLYSGYSEDSLDDLHGESNMVLKIAHWNRRLEVYELNRQTGHWFGNLLRLDNLVPYDRFIVIQPNVLGCAVVANSLRLVNLYSKNMINTEFYVTLPHINTLKVQVIHTSRANFLNPTSRDRIEFIMGYYITESSSIYLYKVTLNLQVIINDQFVYLDQLGGNALLDDQSSIQMLMEVFLPESTNQLKNVLLTYEGIHLVYHEDSLAMFTTCQYRSWSDIIEGKPTELLDSAISKLDYEDTFIEDEELLRNRMVMPDRFPYGLLFRENSELYTRIKLARADQLHSEIKQYTKNWATHYRLRELIEFRGIIFGIRTLGITILTKTPSYIQYYYDNFVKMFERTTKQRLRKNKQGQLLSEHESSIASRFSSLSLYERLGVSLDSCDQIASDQQLVRGKPNNQQDRIYSRLLKVLREILSRPLQFYEGGSGSISPLAANLALSQTRHQIMVVTELLYRLYPQSRQDISYDDRRAIRIIFRINRLLQSNFQIFSRTQIVIQRLTEIPVFLDLLNLFALMTLRQNNSLLFTSILNPTDVVESLIRRILGGIVWLHSSPDKISYSRKNQLLNFACQMADEPLRLVYYIQQLIEQKAIPTNKQFLMGCAIGRKNSLLKQRLFQLPGNIFQQQYNEIIGMFKTNTTSLDINSQNSKARSIVQSVKLPKNPEVTTANDLISQTNDVSCKKTLRMIFRNAINERELKEQWEYLRTLIRIGKVEEVLVELTNKKQTRISQIHNRYRKIGNPLQMSILLRNLFEVQCEAFDRLQEDNESSRKVLDLIKTMKLTLQESLTENAQAQGQTLDACESEFLQDFKGTLYGKLPTRSLMNIIEAAQSSYPINSAIPFNLIPRHVVFSMLKSTDPDIRRNLMKNLQQYFTNTQIATEIVTQSEPSQLNREEVNLLSYAPINYAKLINRSNEASKLLGMISPSEYMCLERQATLPKQSIRQGPTMK